MKGDRRQLVKIVKEICQEHNISLQSFSDEWILELTTNSRTMYIYGYKFPNNNASIEQICNDKSALSDILNAHNIPHVPHYYFISPNNQLDMDPNGDCGKMQALLHQYGTLVCKPNAGTGGRNVYKVSSRRELEHYSHEIFSKSRAMAVAPYREILAEYRIIIVNSNVGVIYTKIRPSVTGNGVDSIKRLIEKNFSLAGVEIDDELDILRIPVPGEIVEVSWKHNLGQGAHPVIVSDDAKKEELTTLALSCADILEAEFMSIDIIEDECGLEILEINSGVMMENFAKSSFQNYLIAKDIYEKAIIKYFGIYTQKNKYFIQKPRVTHFVLPVLEKIARERNIQIIHDKEEGNYAIFVFQNGKRFVAKDYPFNINYAGSISLCTNKAACASFLNQMGFQVPKQKYFVKKEDINVTILELIKHFENPNDMLGFDFPMIIKPNGLSQGTGVFKITNAKDGLMAAHNILSLKDKIFILQEYCQGSDYRVVVLNNQVIQAYKRIPFQIIGNGSDTIESLLQEKIKSFEEAERDKKVNVDDRRILQNIANQGYNINSILDDGVICRLQDVANLSLGGTTEDKTDQISPFYSDLAIKIADSLNLKLCGIDIIAKDITDIHNTDYTILEVNSAPGLDNYAYNGQEQAKYVKRLYSMVFDYLEQIE